MPGNLPYFDLNVTRGMFRGLENEYIQLLSDVVGGYLLPGNLRAFDCCVRNMPEEGSMLEIGSFMGLSTNILTYALFKFGRKNPFFSCDAWCFAGTEKPKAGFFWTGSDDYRQWVKGTYERNMNLFSKDIQPFTIESFSGEFFEKWEKNETVTDVFGREVTMGGPISFAYIDGAHTYQEVHDDFKNVDRYLMPGGFVLFDDSSDMGVFDDIKRVMIEIMQNDDYNLVLKCPNYCFQKRGVS